MNTLYCCRNPTENADRSPLKQLQSQNCIGPAITIQAPSNHRLNHTTSGGHLLSNGREHSPDQINGTAQEKELPIVNGRQINDNLEQGQAPVGYGSKFSCQWNEATAEDGRIHEGCTGGQNEDDKRKERGGKEPNDEENTEQKLYKIANELLQTERAYVARLHLLDQVSVVTWLWLQP